MTQGGNNNSHKPLALRLLALVLCAALVGGMGTPLTAAALAPDAAASSAAQESLFPDLSGPQSTAAPLSTEAPTGTEAPADTTPVPAPLPPAVNALTPAEPPAGSIRVTFRIDEAAYTNAPTYVSVPQAYPDSELTFTEAGGSAYGVTGTGILTTAVIPAGTALGEAMPAVTVLFGSENKYTHSVNWLTESNTICTANTLLDADTVLHLRLYTGTELRSVEFVCGGSYTSSISGALGMTLPWLAVGESLPADCFPTAEQVTGFHHSDGCPNAGKTLAGWQVYNIGTQAWQDFGPGMAADVALFDQKDPTTLRITAKWQEPQPVTATFVYGEQQIDQRTLAPGTALGALPDMSSYETAEQRFAGWQYTDETGDHFADAADLLTADRTYTAVFVPRVYHTVTLHDIQPDGSELTAWAQVEEGLPLSDAAALGAVTLTRDELAANLCGWYTLQGEARTDMPLDTPVTGPMELYTYTYALEFSFTPEQQPAARAMSRSAVEVTPGENGSLTMKILARDRVPLKPQDFIIDGVDYTQYEWTDESGQPFDLADLTRSGVTRPMKGVSKGKPKAGIIKDQKFHFFIIINGTLQSVPDSPTLVDIHKYEPSWDQPYRGVSDVMLESVYAPYGFTADQLKPDSHIFPYGYKNTWGNEAVCFDLNAVSLDGHVMALMDSRWPWKDDHLAVLYVPDADTKDRSGYGPISNYKDISFYTVDVTDNFGQLDDTDPALGTRYVFHGKSLELTLPALPEDFVWVCDDAGVNVPPNGGTVTLTNVTKPYTFSQKSTGWSVAYDLTPGDMPYYDRMQNPQFSTPRVLGKSLLTVPQKAGSSHTVMEPNPASYFFSAGKDPNNQKYLGIVTFAGWAETPNATAATYQVGEKITRDAETALTLYPVWTVRGSGENGDPFAGNGESEWANFFVYNQAVPEGTQNIKFSGLAPHYTPSVYTTEIGAPANLFTSGGDHYLLPTENAPPAKDVSKSDAELRQKLTSGSFTANGYTLKATFPSDEHVLRTIRNQVENGLAITLGSKTLTSEDLTTQNFAIKWYTFFNGGDGWHIDGVLVSRTGQLNISKTFTGDPKAIAEAKKNFKITVTPKQSGGIHRTRTLTLDGANGSVKPTLHHAETDTYLWTIPVDQYYQYNITESGHEVSSLGTSTVLTESSYRVTESAVPGENTNGWLPYRATGVTGVTVTARSHSDSEKDHLSVALRNSYTLTNTLVLKKVEKNTGAGMEGVEFTLARDDKPGFVVYQESPGHYTTTNIGGEGTTTLVTGAGGQLFLTLNSTTDAGNYSLTEALPVGYHDPGTIHFSAEVVPLIHGGNENGLSATIKVGSVSADNNGDMVFAKRGTDSIDNSDPVGERTIAVTNYPIMVPLTVTKTWLDHHDEPVDLRLYINGRSMPDVFSVTLDGTTTGWSKQWKQVPLYTNGVPAVYTVREEAIGRPGNKTYYSGGPDGFADGYEYYNVETPPMQYVTAGGTPATIDTAHHIEMRVTNEFSDGSLFIRKADEGGNPLPGAKFSLYAFDDTDVSGKKSSVVVHEGQLYKKDDTAFAYPLPAVASAVSDSEGHVNFGQQPTGKYYVVETAAPSGYFANDTLYAVDFIDMFTKLYEFVAPADGADRGSWAFVAGNKVINTHKPPDTTLNISKTVAGRMGDKTRSFAFTVQSDQPLAPSKTVPAAYSLSADGLTASFSLAHNETISLEGVPIGAILTVTETDAGGYDVAMTVNGTSIKPASSASTNAVGTYTVPEGDAVTIQVVNTCEGSIETGIFTDSTPYLLLLCAVLTAGAVLTVRRRRKPRHCRH